MSAARLARLCAGLFAAAPYVACTPTDFVFVPGEAGAGGPGASGPSSASGSAGGGGAGGSTFTYHFEDPLEGSSLGNPIGGSLGPDGWTVTDRTDRIWYALPRLVEGSIEVTVENLSLANLPLVDHELLTMYEAGYGITEPINYNPEYRDNHYKVRLRVQGTAAGATQGQQELIWRMCPAGAPGHGECACTEYFADPDGGDPAWDGSPQRLRIEWGNGQSSYSRNGALIHMVTWNELVFAPEELHFSLGTSRAVDIAEAGMPVGAVFSDLVIDGNEGEVATCP